MVGPCVHPGIKDIDLFTCLWVYAREIGTLEGVASVTGVSEPTQVVIHFIHVLSGNDVLYVKWDERRNGMKGVATCGIRQYSHRSPALRRTTSRVAASIYEEQRARNRRAFD